MKNYAGNYALYRNVKPRGRWKDPAKPSYDPHWLVAFSFPQMPRKRMTAELYPICDLCLAVEGNPVELRPNCECVKRVSKWAEEWLKTQTFLMQEGKVKELQQMRAPVRVAAPAEVWATYEGRGPADKKKRLNNWRLFVDQTTGKKVGEVPWSFYTTRNFLTWAEIRQEAGRRGWLALKPSEFPPTGWQELRALAESGGLPALNKRVASTWNTTIHSYLTQIKSIFGKESRQNALRDLTLPDLTEFLELSLDLPTPKGHKALTNAQLQALLEGADKLKKTDLRKWVINQLLMRFSCRPEEVQAARPTWLERVNHKGVQRTRIVIINREDEGFDLKAGAVARERMIWMPEDLVKAIDEVSTPGSLIGAKHKTDAEKLVQREHSQWVRKTAKLTGTQTNYLFRHLGAAERMTSQGAGAAAALLGHSGEALIHSTYGKNLETLEPIDDGELLRRLVD